jgi:hypothetical protein
VRGVLPIGVVIAASAIGALLGMRQHPRALSATFVIPRATTPIKIDGELDEATWTTAPARTGAFVGKPYSDARMVSDDATLYLALYAADEDIETRDDAFRLFFDVNGKTSELDVSPKCVVTDHGWSNALVACDVDGTINDSSDMDEEWVVEMALPLASIGIGHDEPFGLRIERCDTPKNERRSCTSWSQRVLLAK